MGCKEIGSSPSDLCLTFDPSSLWVKLDGPIQLTIDFIMLLDERMGCKTWVLDEEEGKVYVLLGALLHLKETLDTEWQEPLSQKALYTADTEIVHKNTALLVIEGILRPYQAEMVNAALNASWGRGILKAPPGSGKTAVAAAIMAVGSSIGFHDWTYVVCNMELSLQASVSFEKLVPAMCEVMKVRQPNVTSVSYGLIQEAMRDGVIVDECHGLPAETRAMAYAGLIARFRIGMSATPLNRSDERNGQVLSLIGPIAYEITQRELEELGYVAKSSVEYLDWDKQTLN